MTIYEPITIRKKETPAETVARWSKQYYRWPVPPWDLALYTHFPPAGIDCTMCGHTHVVRGMTYGLCLKCGYANDLD